MRTQIVPKYVSNKTSSKGRQYFEIEDEMGRKHTCFEKEVAQFCMANFGKNIEVEIAESNGFSNLRSAYGLAQGTPVAEHVRSAPKANNNAPIPTPAKYEEARDEKNAIMLTSYAKDMFCEAMKSPFTTAESFSDANLIMQFETMRNILLTNYKEILKSVK